MADPTRKKSLRQRIADWPPLTNAVGAMLAGYIRLVRVTARWEEDGYDAVRAAIEEHGAVILVLWHQRTFGTSYIIDYRSASVQGLTADSRAGRLAAAMLRNFGFGMTPMPKGKQGLRAVRVVLRGLSDGISVGIAVDGPRGPAREAKAFPLQWARASGKPIFLFTYSANRFFTWPSWDKMRLPMPFARVLLCWRRWRSIFHRGSTPVTWTPCAHSLIRHWMRSLMKSTPATKVTPARAADSCHSRKLSSTCD